MITSFAIHPSWSDRHGREAIARGAMAAVEESRAIQDRTIARNP